MDSNPFSIVSVLNSIFTRSMKKTLPKYTCTLYLSLWVIYGLRGLLYDAGAFSKIITISVYVITVMLYVYTNIYYPLPKLFKRINFFLALMTVYGAILLVSTPNGIYSSMLDRTISSSQFLTDIYISLMPIFAFFVFGRQGLLSEVSINRWFPVFLFVVIATFFFKRELMLDNFATLGVDRDEFTNNTGYLFLSLLPILVFYYKKRTSLFYVLLGVCLAFIFLSFKRGAILIAVLCTLVIFLYIVHNSKKNKKWIVSIISLFFLIIAVHYVNVFYTQSEYFQRRVELTMMGDSNGRDLLQALMVNYLVHDATPTQLIFGSGAYATIKMFPNFAHNDWLEIAVCEGILGLIVYLLFWVTTLKQAIRVRNKGAVGLVLLTAILICFLRSFFSMSYGDTPIYLCIAIGYSMSQFNKEELC